MPTILLTGATGYIGSHTWLALQSAWDSFHAWRATRQSASAEATAPSRFAPRLRAAGVGAGLVGGIAWLLYNSL